jgi:TetR/AcrR family transcriptional regulator, lmrAB and yxaGH operons repressor
MPRTLSARADALPALTEVFRTHGYEGASLALITQATGLGKGSLYNFFPGGKEDMALAVLAEVSGWFEANMFAPLRENPDPRAAIAGMFASAADYFRSGRRACLVGAFALDASRDRFALQINGYFSQWRDALTGALIRAGRSPAEAADKAEAIVAGIQGAVVAARALDDPQVFDRRIAALAASLA